MHRMYMCRLKISNHGPGFYRVQLNKQKNTLQQSLANNSFQIKNLIDYKGQRFFGRIVKIKNEKIRYYVNWYPDYQK